MITIEDAEIHLDSDWDAFNIFLNHCTIYTNGFLLRLDILPNGCLMELRKK